MDDYAYASRRHRVRSILTAVWQTWKPPTASEAGRRGLHPPRAFAATRGETRESTHGPWARAGPGGRLRLGGAGHSIAGGESGQGAAARVLVRGCGEGWASAAQT